ncbi:MAG: hypothetical protein ACI4TK_07915 [Agathobacter sp.]
MKIKRKKMWICLLVVGIAVAVVVGILIYADFSFQFFVVPLVVDMREVEGPTGLALKLLELFKK